MVNFFCSEERVSALRLVLAVFIIADSMKLVMVWQQR